MAKTARRPSMLGAGLAALVALSLLASACGGVSGIFDMDEMHRQQCGRGYAPEAIVSRVLSQLAERAPAVNFGYCPDCRLPTAMGKNCGSPEGGG